MNDTEYIGIDAQASSDEPVPFVQLSLNELEPLLVPALNDSNTDYTCDLCCDSSICSACANTN